jgi:cell division protein FtsN
MNTQRGGTLLGLIIGALIGLGAALAVAVYITKVPVPFMNKSQARNPDSDAVEAKKNKDWNPNAPLAGKNQPKPPPPACREVPGVPVPDPAVAAPKAAASAPPRPPSRHRLPTRWAIWPRPRLRVCRPAPAWTLSAISSRPALSARLKTPSSSAPSSSLLGMQAKVTEREQAGRTVFRVRLGPFDKKEDADKAKERLDNNSIETALVRVQR